MRQQRLLRFQQHSLRFEFRGLFGKLGQQFRRDIAPLLNAHDAIFTHKGKQIAFHLGDFLRQAIGLLG